jgi:hypothetical protein
MAEIIASVAGCILTNDKVIQEKSGWGLSSKVEISLHKIDSLEVDARRNHWFFVFGVLLLVAGAWSWWIFFEITKTVAPGVSDFLLYLIVALLTPPLGLFLLFQYIMKRKITGVIRSNTATIEASAPNIEDFIEQVRAQIMLASQSIDAAHATGAAESIEVDPDVRQSTKQSSEAFKVRESSKSK